MSGFFTFLIVEKGNGKDRTSVVSRIPPPSVYLSCVLYLHFQFFGQAIIFFFDALE